MSTNYPNSQDSYVVHQDGAVETVTAADVNNLQDAVVAIEQTLGSGTTKPTSSATANAIVSRDANGTASLNALSIPGLAGATTLTRIVGGTNGSAPTTGTWNVGDEVTDVTGTKWICTTAGTPGTWTKINSGNADKLGNNLPSFYAPINSPNFTGTPQAASKDLLQAIAGGYKVQSGQGQFGQNTATVITFPTAFSTAPIVVATAIGTFDVLNIPSVTTTNFQALATHNGSADIVQGYWIAIGT